MRILLVEDSHDIAEPIMAKLKREGHNVTLTDNGHDGESFALSGEFDVIVLDINLPGQNGFDVLASVRRNKVGTPVLVITARNQVADKVSLLDLGADDYLVKPFDLSELAARVRALARRGMGLSRSEIRVGQLHLDLNTRAAWLEGCSLDLGKREFEILGMLAASATSFVNKGQLVTRLFGTEDTGTPNAIELLVSRLRRKLEGSDIEILTQRGTGYCLRARDGRKD